MASVYQKYSVLKQLNKQQVTSMNVCLANLSIVIEEIKANCKTLATFFPPHLAAISPTDYFEVTIIQGGGEMTINPLNAASVCLG